MKLIILLLALACSLRAELLATFQTTQGDIVVALQYDKAPQAVANFITLAQGTRKHVDPITGFVTNTPFYNGIKIHRTSNTGSFKFAQGGSPKGDGSDGPGYTFKDEFNATQTHVPYVLSMANAGPNTNGSQFFFTGSLSQATFNNVHTIFGLVSDPASRVVVDAMITAGSNATTITGVIFARTDAAAINFNEQAQNLPEVTQPDGNLTVMRGVSATWHPTQSIGTDTIFRAFRSTTLNSGSWVELNAARHYVGLDATSLTAAVLDDATAPKAFYNLSVARHPGSVTPSSLANRTVTIPLGNDTLRYAFDASGVAGTTTFSPASAASIVGPFTTVNPNTGLPQAPAFEAHNAVFTADCPALNPRYLWYKIGCDSTTATLIAGHLSIDYYDSLYGWQPFTTGSVMISR